MHVYQHVALSSVISLLCWLFFRSATMAWTSFLAGVFIDLDHWVEYAREYGRIQNIRHFLGVFRQRQLRQVYLVLHGWEWLVLGVVMTWLTQWPPWLCGLLVGWSIHLVADQLYNKPVRWGYSLLWRWSKGFRMTAMFPD